MSLLPFFYLPLVVELTTTNIAVVGCLHLEEKEIDSLYGHESDKKCKFNFFSISSFP
jgi:hypothetical protein